jgi:hypothetical protein
MTVLDACVANALQHDLDFCAAQFGLQHVFCKSHQGLKTREVLQLTLLRTSASKADCQLRCAVIWIVLLPLLLQVCKMILKIDDIIQPSQYD